MAGSIKYSELQTSVAEKCGVSTAVAADLTRVKKAINSAVSRLTAGRPLNSRQRFYSFNTIASYKTGTATFTAESRTVAGSGTAWTDAMIGRWIRCENDDTAGWYQIIARASGTSITVDQPYAGNTASGATYIIAPRYYDLPSNVLEVITVKPPGCAWVPPRPWVEFIEPQFSLLQDGQPQRFSVFSGPETRTEYTVASIVGTKDSELVTKATGGFLGTIEQGDRLMTFNTTGNSYDVQSVDSDTQITLAQRIVETTATPATTTFERRRTCRLWVSPIPERIYRIDYAALVQIYNLIHDDDTPKLPPDWRDLIIIEACVDFMDYTQDARKGEFVAQAGQLKLLMEQDSAISSEPNAKWKGLNG